MKKYRHEKGNIVKLLLDEQKPSPDELSLRDVVRLLIYSAAITEDHEMAVTCFGMLGHQYGKSRMLATKQMREAVENIDKDKLAAYVIKYV